MRVITTHKYSTHSAGYAEGYGFIIAPCPVADPKKKGRVEAGVKYVKNTVLRLYRTTRNRLQLTKLA